MMGGVTEKREWKMGYDFTNTYTDQEGVVWDWDYATCPRCKKQAVAIAIQHAQDQGCDMRALKSSAEAAVNGE